jgi:hypothetical protein
MNRLTPIATLISALSLVACEKPTVVNVTGLLALLGL